MHPFGLIRSRQTGSAKVIGGAAGRDRINLALVREQCRDQCELQQFGGEQQPRDTIDGKKADAANDELICFGFPTHTRTTRTTNIPTAIEFPSIAHVCVAL